MKEAHFRWSQAFVLIECGNQQVREYIIIFSLFFRTITILWIRWRLQWRPGDGLPFALPMKKSRTSVVILIYKIFKIFQIWSNSGCSQQLGGHPSEPRDGRAVHQPGEPPLLWWGGDGDPENRGVLHIPWHADPGQVGQYTLVLNFVGLFREDTNMPWIASQWPRQGAVHCLGG